MAQDIEKLTLTLEANIKTFERDMEKARRAADKSLGDIEKKAKTSSSGVEGALDRIAKQTSRTSQIFANFAGTLLGNLAGKIGGAALSGAIAAVTTELTTLGEAARRADLSVANMQAIRDLAGLKGIKQATVDSDIQGLGGAAAEQLRDGEGKLFELFEANNLKLTDRAGKLKTINQLLIDAAGLVQNSNNAFDASKIVEMLGLSKDWVSVLREGPDTVRRIIDEGTAANSSLAEMVTKAEAFDKAWSEAAKNVGTVLKNMAMDALSYLGDLITFIDTSISKMQTLTDEQRLAALTSGDLIGAATGFGHVPDAEVPFRGRELTIGGKDKPKTGKATVIPKKKEKSGAETKDEYDREISSIEKKTRALEGEAAAVGLTVFEGAKAEALAKLNLAAKQAEIDLSPAQIAANLKIAESYAAISEKLKNLQLANQQFIELQNFAGQSMIDIFKGAASGADGLRSAIKKLADSLLDATFQAMILGKGPLAGLFGTGNASNGGVGGLIGGIFSAFGGGATLPGRAAGGPVTGGRPYLIGEKGPEIMVPGHSGAVFPIAMGGGRGAGGNNVNVQQSFVISGAFTKDDARAMAAQAATQAGQATRQSVLAELNSQRKRA